MIGYFHKLLFFLGHGLAYCYQLIPNYGVAIILLTVGVRLVMLPLTIKQTRSMQEMQKLQPEVKRLQAKYKGGDRQKLNEEMMALYKEHQVNPLGGCLPLVLQLPIFLALYRLFEGCLVRVSHAAKVVAYPGQVGPTFKACPTNFVGVRYLPVHSQLRTAITGGHSGFLGINLGLSPAQALHAGGLAHAWPAYLMVFLMVLTTWYQQKQIMAVSTGQQAAQMQMMSKIMPLILGVFSLTLPAGVSIYWVASNVWTIGQQRFILGKTAGTSTDAAAAPPSPRDATAGKVRPRPGAKMAERLADRAAQAKATAKAAPDATPPPPRNGQAARNGQPKTPRPADSVPGPEDAPAVAEFPAAAPSRPEGSGNGRKEGEKASPQASAAAPAVKPTRPRSAVGPDRSGETGLSVPAPKAPKGNGPSGANPPNTPKVDPPSAERKSAPRPPAVPRPGAPARPQSQRGGSNAKKKRKR